MNRIILNKSGNTWIGFWTLGIDEQLKKISDALGSTENKYWVIEKDGTLRAAQTTWNGAMQYMTNDRILVSAEGL